MPGHTRYFLLVSVVVLGLVAILASGGGGGGGGDDGDDITVSLSTAGGATTVASGATLTIRANVANTISDMSVTWALSGPNCPDDCGTIAPTSTDFADYQAPANVSTEFTVTVTATSVENPAKSGSVTLTVQARNCPATAALLNGQYAFLLQGFSSNAGSGPGIATVGSFTADGCGLISGGVADYYFGPTTAGNAALTGSYTIEADHRGILTLEVGAVTQTFAIALGKVSAGVASKGGLTETAPSVPPTILSGTLWLQDPTAFAQNQIAGPYAFVFNGWNASVNYGSGQFGPREAMGGTVIADGAGVLTSSGPLSDKVYGATAPATTANWSGAYEEPSADGRSVLLAPALAGANGSAVIYVVNANQLIVMISDTSSSGRVFSGSMLAQTGTFDAGSLSGDIVVYQTANYNQAAYEALTMSVLTLAAPDGAGNLPFTSLDVNSGGNISHTTNFSGYTYTVAANGQATISLGSIDGGRWYMTGQNTGLMLGFDDGVSVGMILPQEAGTYTPAAISGDYFASQAPGGSIQSPYSSGTATSTGNGTLDTTMDILFQGFIPGQQASGTLTADALITGRFTDTNNNVIYAISPDSFLMLNIASGNSAPVIQLFEQ